MTHFQVAPLPGQGSYGALVTGLAPDDIDAPEVHQALHDLWVDKGLVVFRGIAGGVDTQLRLSAIYGEPEIHPMMTGTDIKTEHKALAPVEYDRESGNLYEVKGRQLGGYLPWHFDAAYVDRINHGGILRLEVLPRRGGETGFLDQEPGVGAVVHQAPKQVRIEFNAKLEGAFSTVTVKDSAGKTVSGGSRVGPDAQSLGAALAPLAPGEYHVYWKVVAWDGHTTEGDYIFSVRP